MNDFGAKVRQAENDAKAKASVSQSSKSPKAPFGYKKDGTPRKRKATSPGRWKPGEIPEGAKPFQPGVSGNPGGKVSLKPITDALRAHGALPYTGKEAKYKGLTNAQVLAVKQFELAIDSGDMRAATEIMDRIEGKTVQVQQLQGSGGGAVDFVNRTPAENEKRIAELLAKAANRT